MSVINKVLLFSNFIIRRVRSHIPYIDTGKKVNRNGLYYMIRPSKIDYILVYHPIYTRKKVLRTGGRFLIVIILYTQKCIIVDVFALHECGDDHYHTTRCRFVNKNG